ncbi:MAG: GNAT family N-acetyltransferase [Pseudomonadota bacterium]
MSSLSFIPVTASHLPVLVALHRECFARLDEEGGLCLGEVWARDAMTDMLAMPSTFAQVLQEGDEPIGFLMVQVLFEAADLLTLGVVPSRRCAGMGGALLDRAMGLGSEKGSKRLTLEVACDNKAALALYRSKGFQEIGRRTGYFRRPNAVACDALVLAKALTDIAMFSDEGLR